MYHHCLPLLYCSLKLSVGQVSCLLIDEDPLQGFSLQLVMGTINDKSDDVYSYVGDKGDIGFIDFDNCQSVCSYNPAEESDTFNISVPFHLIEGRKPQSGIVGETMSDSVTIRNTTNESLDLWSVKIFDSKP
ncbi:probable RNA helicase SDE3, partial [Salvia splendens]|uniref:probable RNA helicase SDE3 n=1 Tax=Salvia splendens TaxID=180675 RepID=UPI001C279B37